MIYHLDTFAGEGLEGQTARVGEGSLFPCQSDRKPYQAARLSGLDWW